LFLFSLFFLLLFIFLPFVLSFRLQLVSLCLHLPLYCTT
jgi:hypothetical protein